MISKLWQILSEIVGNIMFNLSEFREVKFEKILEKYYGSGIIKLRVQVLLLSSYRRGRYRLESSHLCC